MKKFILLFITIVFLSFGSAAFSIEPTGTAQFEYYLKNFDSVIKLENSPIPKATIEESITVKYLQPKQGIIRYVPSVYSSGLFSPRRDINVNYISVTDFSGTPINNVIQEESKGQSLRIGTEGVFRTGEVNYRITYTIENFVLNMQNDEINLDINGTGWDVPVEKVSATLFLPEEIKINQTSCYTGVDGSSESSCQISEQSNNVNFYSNRELKPGETLTVSALIEPGYFEQISFWQEYGLFLIYSSAIALPVFIFFRLLKKWQKFGKDPEGKGVIIPQYSSPLNYSPAHVGQIYDKQSDSNDISATIIDLAIKGYIKVHDISKDEKTKKRKYELELVNTDKSLLKSHEAILLEGLFKSYEKGEKIKMDELKNKFYKTANKFHKDVRSSLVAEGVLVKKPNQEREKLIAMAALFVFIGFILIALTQGYAMLSAIGFWLSAVITLIFAVIMPKPTLKWVELNEYLRGFKSYLEVAEAERIDFHQNPYSKFILEESDTPGKKTANLYEKLLPFAIVFGVEEKWGEQFKDIYSKPPEWYDSNAPFRMQSFSRNLHNGVSAMGSNYSSPSASGSYSSGGFSGGGSSGGGFGGGGGSSW